MEWAVLKIVICGIAKDHALYDDSLSIVITSVRELTTYSSSIDEMFH